MRRDWEVRAAKGLLDAAIFKDFISKVYPRMGKYLTCLGRVLTIVTPTRRPRISTIHNDVNSARTSRSG